MSAERDAQEAALLNCLRMLAKINTLEDLLAAIRTGAALALIEHEMAKKEDRR